MEDNQSPPDQRQQENAPLLVTRDPQQIRNYPSWLRHVVGQRRTSNQNSMIASNLDSAHPHSDSRRVPVAGFRFKFALVLALLQILLLGIFLKFTRYKYEIDAGRDPENSLPLRNRTNDTLSSIYPLFQDDSMLIFFGISFLYFFMKKYGFTSAGYNFFICCLGIEVSILLQGFLRIVVLQISPVSFIEVDIRTLLQAEFSAVTVPISLGCVLGKIGPVQLLLFSLVEIILFNLLQTLGLHVMFIADAGGSVFLHAFACYYGMAACAVLYNPEQETSKNLAVSHTTDLFSIGGTLMLWCLWPSFNSGLLEGDQQHRAIVNTFLSLVGSCLATFCISSYFSARGKFNMTHIQNATLAGGVAIGSCCNLMIGPGGALIVGSIAGMVCTTGMHYGSPWLSRVLKVHDVSSVHNLHGLPALVAVVSSAVMVIWATRDHYGESLYTIYPAMAPDGSQLTKAAHNLGVKPGKGWTRAFQAMMQLISFIVTVVTAVLGGIFAGYIMRLKWLDEPPAGLLYTDDAFWEPKAGKVLWFDASAATAGSPNSVRRSHGFVHPENLQYMVSQSRRFGPSAELQGCNTPNLSDIEEDAADGRELVQGDCRP